MRTPVRRTLAPVRRLAALAAAVLLAGCPAPATKPPPNVVLISIDCLSHTQLDAALAGGASRGLAALAGDSILFTRAYANAPWTTPSHMTMLTGLYPSQHGRDVPWTLMRLVNATYDRAPTFATLADRLAARGYETAAFVGKGPISAMYGLGQGFAHYHEAAGTVDAWDEVQRHVARDYTDFGSTDEAVRQWIESRRPGPFFLFVHTFDLHDPRSPQIETDREALHHIDTYVARILFRLRQTGLYDHSLIILTGDHGSRMPNAAGKCCVHGAGHYEDNLHVPLLLKLPGVPAPGRSDLLVRHVDLFATVLDAIGEPLGAYRGPGVSILQRLRRAPGTPDPVGASYSEADGRCVSRRALVTPRYKYIYTPYDERGLLLSQTKLFVDSVCPEACTRVAREELYDLSADPAERHDLLLAPLDAAAAAALAHLRGEMQRHLNLPPQYRVGLSVAGFEGAPRAAATPDAATEEAMRRLGYLPDQ